MSKLNLNFSAFHRTVGSTIGFRECVRIIQIAEETNTVITLNMDKKSIKIAKK